MYMCMYVLWYVHVHVHAKEAGRQRQWVWMFKLGPQHGLHNEENCPLTTVSNALTAHACMVQ